MTPRNWPYPGSGWWKFDFHTHTPQSHDTPWFKQNLPLSPEEWLLKYMAAGIDCVAVTDHNSGAWIDPLKSAYAAMKAEEEQGRPRAGFRELALFPGVELSVQGGIHLLALFDPSCATADINRLLGRVGFVGTDGDCDAVTREGLESVLASVIEVGGIPIPAHADSEKGMLRFENGSTTSGMDTTSLKQALAVDGLLAVEWCDITKLWPTSVKSRAPDFAHVLGSDCHTFKSSFVPGSRFTWVKMATPTLDGLRLALLDGNETSIRRSDEGAFDPFRVPKHVITAIEIDKARVMGNGSSARMSLSPFFNAIVGGRGTGKSTVVHALRLASRRDQELKSLGDGNAPAEQFEAFRKPTNGALRENTALHVEWQHEETRLRLSWRADAPGPAVEEWQNEQWQRSSSQSVNASRIPLRIFSQGQIAAMATSGRKALLSIIDEAADVLPLQQSFADARRTFLTLRARLRELEGKLAGRAEVERKRNEVLKKLSALTQSDHASVLRTFAQAQLQNREIKSLLDQLKDGVKRIDILADQIVLDDWTEQHFLGPDAELLAWRNEMGQGVEEIRAGIRAQGKNLQALVDSPKSDARMTRWWERYQAAKDAHTTLQQQLAQQGVSDPQAFARLTQDREQLDIQLKVLQQMQADHQTLQQQIDSQKALMLEKHRAITQQRKSFIQGTLSGNKYVRMEVVPFGFDAESIERELRELIDVQDDRFQSDILDRTDGVPSGGLAFDLAGSNGSERLRLLESARQRLIAPDADMGGQFRNHLKRKLERPEFADHVSAWFPEDDLKIEYQRGKIWTPIQQGSQGQRSASLLAFLLAFGEEPIVLDQPEDDLDNHLIYDLIVRQIRENKLRRQLIIVTHNPNVVVNGDAELVHVMEFGNGQCFVKTQGSLQEADVRREVCRVMEGGHEAFSRRWKRLGREV